RGGGGGTVRPPPLVEPAPVVEPVPEEEAVAEPLPVPKAAKAAPKKTVTKPTENAKKISYKEFVQKQGKPVAKNAKAAPKKTAKLDTQSAKLALTKALGGKGGAGGANGVAGGTAVEGARVDSFNSALLRKIDAAWMRPNAVIAEGMSVVVEFEVSSTGKIAQVRIVQSSGNDAIDQSVREAFIKVGNAGKPPHAEGGVYRLRFRVE
ncbi:MAG: hypothetical protein B7X06_01345, partial [Verrucomicrobia bacterium 21-51-4]